MNFDDRSMAEIFMNKAKRLVTDSCITVPPVNPLELARRQGIRRVVLSDNLDVSGQLVRESGDFVIVLNARESPERRNFSCCHEIAHTFALDHSFSKFRLVGDARTCVGASPEERLCDRAAAEMLMPEKFFTPLASELEASIDSLARLAKIFGASLRATIVRAAELGVWPVIFIGWKFAPRLGSSHKLRVSWSVRPAGSRRFIPRHASADLTSGMYATFTSGCQTLETAKLELGSLRGKYLVENGRFGEHVVSIVHDSTLRRRL